MGKAEALDTSISHRRYRFVRWLIVASLAFLAWQPALANNHFTRINELMAGLNGDSSIQFIELVAQDAVQKRWGPNDGEVVGRAMLVFFDPTGARTGRYVMPYNAPGAPDGPSGPANTVLIATQAFADLAGITPDYIIPEGVMPIAGKVCFMRNDDNNVFDATLCLSYGGAAFTGDTEEDSGLPHPSDVTIMDSQSLTRFENYSFGDAANFGLSNNNTSFTLATPTPNSTQNNTFDDSNGNLVFDDDDNTIGEVSLPTATSVEVQGEKLFSDEGFLGNGRTCATCHVAADGFGLKPETVAALPSTDLLFLNAININTLVVNSLGSVNPGSLTGTTQPSDFFLGQTITGSLGGSATVLAGTGTTYLVYGGADLDVPGNVISDDEGNTGTLVSFTTGNLSGPNPVNGEARGLEDTVLLNGGRALITENINGFPEKTFMRTSPNLLNVKHTAPYGLSSDIADLQTFSNGAVEQHFPRRLERAAGVDFRSPTVDELDAMTAFMDTIFLPADEDFDDGNNFDRFATTESQKRGRDLFFGTAKCSACHGGNVLATSDGQFGTTPGVNETFDTGTPNLPINSMDGLPTEEEIGQPVNTREFSTRPLFGVKNTAPFFHDNSTETLLEAIEFYDTAIFRASPSFLQIGSMKDVSITQNALDIEAFLNALVDLPFSFTDLMDFGTQLASAGPTAPMTVTVTNTGSEDLTIDMVTLNGNNSGEFVAGAPMPDAGPFGNGESRTIDVTFDPFSDGVLLATLELAVSDASESWDVGVALRGTGLAPQVGVSPLVLDFGVIVTSDGPSAAETVTITNEGQITLNISSLSLGGANASDFNITSDSGETVLENGESRTVMINFAPASNGAKSAVLTILSDDPDEASVEVNLSGEGADALIFADGFESGDTSAW